MKGRTRRGTAVWPVAALVAAILPGACGHGASSSAALLPAATHSSSLAIARDGSKLYVTHPDLDCVTVVDTASGSIVSTIALAPTPVVDADGNFVPAVEPRALALDPSGRTLFVSGERSGHVYAFDAATGAKLADAAVCAEPIGLLVDAAGERVYVACSEDDTIAELSTDGLAVVATVASPHKPWALAWAPDGATLLSTHLLGWGDAAAAHPAADGQSSPGVTAFTTGPLALSGTWPVVDGPEGGAPTVPHGQVRGVYDAAPRPGSNELWTAHLMLGTDTAQPTLDFQSTVFPTVTILGGGGALAGDAGSDGGESAEAGATVARLTVSTSPGDGAAFGDVVSGPHALAFSEDGRYAFLADSASEDILVVDAEARVEAALVRPLPGHQPEGVVWGPGGKLYVQERNSEDVAVIDVSETVDGAPGVTATEEPSVIGKLPTDPMPASMRLGQHLFHSANSDEYPVTSNHWVSCTSCHIEGRSDAVTWKFLEGPRDTPSNAGGVSQTGFLFRTADRNRVTDYWETIDSEQGGDFHADEPTQLPLLEDLEAYVNHAIPLPVPPTADAATLALQATGRTVFENAHCDGCHSGAWMTDSGADNTSLAMEGPVVQTPTPGGVILHDVGTCVTSPFADAAHETIDGQPRQACLFDTPTLRGVADSAPYLHDGSALTLEDAVNAMLNGVQRDPSGRDVPGTLSASDMAALVAYLKAN